jgi:hypothetical protein
VGSMASGVTSGTDSRSYSSVGAAVLVCILSSSQTLFGSTTNLADVASKMNCVVAEQVGC